MRSRSEPKLRRAGSSISASRCRRFSTIPWVILKRDLSVSGGRVISLSKGSLLHETAPFAGPLGANAPLAVEALPAGAAGDLLEVADGEHGDLLAVELGQAGEEDGADGDV